MRRNGLGWILALAVAFVPANACAMSAPQSACRVVNGEKLPVETGGASAVCAVIEKAIAAKAPGLNYSAEIDVRSKSALVAGVTANGRTLAKQTLAVMDKDLNSASIERFAVAFADEVAKAAKS